MRRSDAARIEIVERGQIGVAHQFARREIRAEIDVDRRQFAGAADGRQAVVATFVVVGHQQARSQPGGPGGTESQRVGSAAVLVGGEVAGEVWVFPPCVRLSYCTRPKSLCFSESCTVALPA